MDVAGRIAGTEPAGVLRGDWNWGTERAIGRSRAARPIAYLFKRKQTAKGKKLIERWFGQDEWVDAGQSWQDRAAADQMEQNAARGGVAAVAAAGRDWGSGGSEKEKTKDGPQLTLDLPEVTHWGVRYECAVLVTSI